MSAFKNGFPPDRFRSNVACGCPAALQLLLQCLGGPVQGRVQAAGSLPGVDYVIDTRRARDAKERALHAHATQGASASKVWGEGETRTQRLSLEPFRVGVGKPIEHPPATDFLAD